MTQRLLIAVLLVGCLAACQAPSRPILMPVSRNAALAAAYGVPEDAKAVAQRAFKKIDTNGDSFLSEAEYVAAQTADYREADVASVKAFLSKQFAKFDRSKDKRLSFTEYLGN